MLLSFINYLLIVIKGSISFLIFFFVSLYMTIIGLIPISRKIEKVERFYFRNFLLYVKLLTKTHFNIKINIVNSNNEQFNKPMVIVCNHQSLFDVSLTLGLFKNIYVVTNNWHNNSPIRYLIEKFVDFIPVTNGIDWVANEANKRIKHNKSALYFPETSRTKNQEILRYHKGAFMLASVLNIDIIPVVIYAPKSILANNWYFFKHGTIKVYIGNRIKNVINNNEDIKIQTKNVCEYSRKIYSDMQNNVI